MNCNKKKQRNFLNLFEIFTCDGCNNDIKYEYIYIGNNTINVYELNNECINDIKKQNMIKLFFKEKIINNNEIYLILYKKEYNKIFDLLPLLIEDNNTNIYILIIKNN